jgi:hypothetical protein
LKADDPNLIEGERVCQFICDVARP